MGELSRAADAVWNAKQGERDDVLWEYGRVRIAYFLTDIEPDIERVRQSVADAKSAEGQMVIDWLTTILYRASE